MIRTLRHCIAAVAMGLALGSCASLASFTVQTAAEISSPIPNQVATLKAAVDAARLVVVVTQAAVDSNQLDIDTLRQIDALRAGVRAAVDELVNQNADGHSLKFGAVNAALLAFNAYRAARGL